MMRGVGRDGTKLFSTGPTMTRFDEQWSFTLGLIRRRCWINVWLEFWFLNHLKRKVIEYQLWIQMFGRYPQSQDREGQCITLHKFKFRHHQPFFDCNMSTVKMHRRRVDCETPETKLRKEFLNVCCAPVTKLTPGCPRTPIQQVLYPHCQSSDTCRYCADCPCDNDNYIRRANSRLGIFLCF